MRISCRCLNSIPASVLQSILIGATEGLFDVSREQFNQSLQWSAEVDEAFPQCADLVRRELIMHRRRYRRLASLHVGWFRTIGGIEIVVGASLPILITLLDPAQSWVQALLTT